jgi:hypothetical protein
MYAIAFGDGHPSERVAVEEQRLSENVAAATASCMAKFDRRPSMRNRTITRAHTL